MHEGGEGNAFGNQREGIAPKQREVTTRRAKFGNRGQTCQQDKVFPRGHCIEAACGYIMTENTTPGLIFV